MIQEFKIFHEQFFPVLIFSFIINYLEKDLKTVTKLIANQNP